MTDLEQRARELANELTGGPIGFEDDDVIYKETLDVLRTIQAETREADARMVSGLIGKDSGNWNRAIAYAVEVIRAKGRT